MATYNRKASTYNSPNNKLNYEVNEYIRCINNADEKRFLVLQNNTAIGIPIEYNKVLPLTIGKIYKVIHQAYKVLIENDLGIKCSYEPDIFTKISVEERRDFQLKKILNEKTI